MQGNTRRTQEPTLANKTSSRSHAVLQVTVTQTEKVRDVQGVKRIGRLFLIDLAGSERAAHTQVEKSLECLTPTVYCKN